MIESYAQPILPEASSPAGVCPRCDDERIDEKGDEALYALFTRKTFKIGGSLTIRTPQEIANVTCLKEGAGVKLAVREKKIVIEPA